MTSRRVKAEAAKTPETISAQLQPRAAPESFAEIDQQQILRELRQVNEQLVISSVREQELADQAQRQSVQWNALVNSLAEGVIVADSEGHLVVANPVARKLLEFPAFGPWTRQRDWKKLDLRTLEGHSLRDEEGPLNRAMRGEAFADLELLLFHSDGSRCQVAFSGSAVRDESDQVVLTIITFRDVTELRQLERAKEEYVSIISHDLRAPLTIIIGRGQLLLRAAERDGLNEIAKEVEIILRSAGQMNGMIQSLLDTARLEAGQIVFKKEPIELSATIRSAVETGVPLPDQPRIRIETVDAPPRVRADRGQIERVILNLVLNALKFSPSDAAVEIHVGAHDGEVVVSVTDRGVGIRPDALPHVFERYYRASAGTKQGGLGLGLYSARLIVEALGGRIWVTSEPGRGSTFSFSMPVA